LANSRFLTDCYREVAALQSAEGRKCDRRWRRSGATLGPGRRYFPASRQI